MRSVQTRGVFGQPNAHGADTTFSAGAISAGLAGEQATAEILDPYGSQAMIFHGLKLPITLRTDIDHLIVRNNAILAIDSKFWRAGRYHALGGKLYRGLSKVNVPDAMTHAVNALTAMFDNAPDHVDVLTVVHSHNNRARFSPSATRLPQPMVDAAAADATIRQWLTDHPGEPNQQFASQIVAIYRQGARK